MSLPQIVKISLYRAFVLELVLFVSMILTGSLSFILKNAILGWIGFVLSKTQFCGTKIAAAIFGENYDLGTFGPLFRILFPVSVFVFQVMIITLALILLCSVFRVAAKDKSRNDQA